jgi:hypothetical protein
VEGAAPLEEKKMQMRPKSVFVLDELETRRLFSGPIKITAGGTYTGTWISTDYRVPAVKIATTAPVTIINSVVKGPGVLIQPVIDHSHVTIKNTTGYGVNPNVYGRAKGWFLDDENFDNINLENNTLIGCGGGFYFLNYYGDKTTSERIRIVGNKARNIDGRKSDGAGAYLTFNERTSKADGHTDEGYERTSFVQFDKVRGVPNVEVAWNQVINDPGQSRVEDDISVYKSGGTYSSPFSIHDNYIQGGYTVKPWQKSYETDNWEYDWTYYGGAIMLGDGGMWATTVPCYVRVFNNQIVSTTNYGLAISSGHDLLAYGNRVVSSGKLPDGRYIASQNTGAYVWNINGQDSSLFYNNHIKSNTIGWMRGTSRNDWWLKNDPYSVNTHWSYNPTYSTEQAEYTRWQNKLAAHLGATTASLETALPPATLSGAWYEAASFSEKRIES